MKALIILALIALTLQTRQANNATMAAMCIIQTEDNEIARILFKQTGEQGALNVTGVFDDLPANGTSVLDIHQFGVVNTCDDVGEIFQPQQTQFKGWDIKHDAEGGVDFNVQTKDYSFKGVNSILGRSCRLTIPYVDQNGVSTTTYGCGNIALVSDKFAGGSGQGNNLRSLQPWWPPYRPWWRCYCPPWKWWCHRPWWCWSMMMGRHRHHH
jgi:hypothetical protein